jgi:HlyD family secretion protein
MTRLRLALLLALPLAGAAGAWMWFAAPPPKAAPAASAPAPAMGVGALGRVEPASRVRRLSHPGGMAVTRIESLLVAEGDSVAKGQVLATFADAAQKDATLAQAEAALAEARANRDRVAAGGRESEIAAQRARIDALRADEEFALREATRQETLVPGGAGTRTGAERARFTAARASAVRREAEAVLETLEGPRVEDVAIAQARVASAEAAVAKARADAALARITAPIAGTVLRTYARPGDQVGSDGLLDLADLSALDVVADVYETDVPRLRIGAAAEVIVPGDPVRYAATVRDIGWQVRRTTQAGTDPVAATDARTVEVRLALSEEGRLALMRRVNMQVQVAIKPGTPVASMPGAPVASMPGAPVARAR